jgi:hypothetical protein
MDPRLLFLSISSLLITLRITSTSQEAGKKRKDSFSNMKVGLYRQTGPAQIRGNKKIPHWVKMATFVDIFFETRDTPALIA